MADRVMHLPHWTFRLRALYFVALLPISDSSDPLSEYSTTASSGAAEKLGPWRVFRNLPTPGATLYLYRRRAIVQIDIDPGLGDDLDTAIRWSVSEERRDAAVATICSVLEPTPVANEIVMLPLLVTDLASGDNEEWIGDGTTSFHFRMYDASEGRQALVRVSRHIVIVAGAGPRILQDVTNLLYEKLLYTAKDGISSESVFSFLDGLARYTIPTENSVFLQREFARLGLLVACVQVIVGVWAVLVGGLATKIAVATVPAMAVVVLLTYLAVRRLRLVDWR